MPNNTFYVSRIGDVTFTFYQLYFLLHYSFVYEMHIEVLSICFSEKKIKRRAMHASNYNTDMLYQFHYKLG